MKLKTDGRAFVEMMMGKVVVVVAMELIEIYCTVLYSQYMKDNNNAFPGENTTPRWTVDRDSGQWWGEIRSGEMKALALLGTRAGTKFIFGPWILPPLV